MKDLKPSKSLTFIVIVILIISLTACGQIFKRPQEKKQPEPQKQEKKEPPKTLTKMEQETEKMVKEIQKVRDQRAQMGRQKQDNAKTQQEGQQDQKQSSDQGGQSKGKEDQSQQGGSKQQESQSKPKQEPTPPEVKWPDFEKSVEGLHNLWNQYEVQAKEDGASESLLNDFEDQMNALTEQVMAHNEDKTLTAANQLYQYYPKFLNLYKHKAPPETKEMKYYTGEIVILAQQEKWDEIPPLMNDMEKAWLIAKARMEKPDKEVNGKIDAAIEDLSRVIPLKNLQLVKLKADILVKNIDEIK